jgi:hypothetical protein
MNKKLRGLMGPAPKPKKEVMGRGKTVKAAPQAPTKKKPKY